MANDTTDSDNLWGTIITLPLMFIGFVFASLKKYAIQHYWLFFGLVVAISLGLAILTVRNIIKESVKLSVLAVGLFTLSFTFLLTIVLNIISLQSNLVTFIIFLALSSFLALFPLFEWIVLIRSKNKDALLPVQSRLENMLEKITKGNILLVTALYVGSFSVVSLLIWIIVRDILISIILTSFLLPLLNLGYITGLSLGDDLLWFKEYRRRWKEAPKKEKAKNLDLQGITINWDKDFYSVHPIGLGHTSGSLLSTLLIMISLYGIYNRFRIINNATIVIGLGAYIVLAKTILLNGRNALSQTKKLWKANHIKEERSSFGMFFPIYIGVSILTIIALEISIRFSQATSSLGNFIGLDSHLNFMYGIFIVQQIAMFAAVGMVFFIEKEPLQIRDYKEKAFSQRSPVEQYTSMEKLYSDVDMAPRLREKVQAFEKAIKAGSDRYNAVKLLPYTISTYDKMKKRAIKEIKEIIENHPEYAKTHLNLLKSEELNEAVQQQLTMILAQQGYEEELKKLAFRNKIRATWIMRPLKGPYKGANVVFIDDEYLYVASKSYIYVWKKGSYEFVKKITGHKAIVRTLYADEKYLYSGSRDTRVRVWDKNSFEQVKSLKGHKGDVYAVTADEKFIYSGAEDQKIIVYDKESLKQVKTFEGHTGTIYGLANSAKYLYSASEDKTVRVWNKEIGKTIRILRGHEDKVWTVFYDTKYIYTGSADNTIKIWKTKNHKLHSTIKAHNSSVFSIYADKNYLYSSSYDRTVAIFDKKTFEEEGRIDILSSYSRNIYGDEKNLYTSTWDQAVLIWDKETIKLIKSPLMHNDRINDIAINKKRVYTASNDNTIKVWQKRRKELNHLETISCPHNVKTLTLDDSYLYVATGDNKLRKYTKDNLEQVLEIDAHDSQIWSLDIDNKYVYTGSRDNSVKVWDKTNLKNIAQLQRHSKTIKALDVDEFFVYTGSDDQTLKIWDKINFQEVKTLENECCIKTIHHDSVNLYIGLDNGMIEVYQKETWDHLKNLEDHTEPVNDIITDDNYIYSASNDNSIKVWSKNTYRLITTIIHHQSWVNKLAMDKKYIYSVSSDKIVKRKKRLPNRAIVNALIPYLIILGLIVIAGIASLIWG